jgi:ribosome biogenesis GTPase A
MNVQWYPGHMAKAKRMMQENIKLIDVVIELVDARIPLSSKNPVIDVLAANKSRVILLNKYDMADPKHNEIWKKYFKAKGYHTALINSKNGQGVKQIKDIVYKACEAKIERDKKRGIINRPVRAMVVGIPNVGKSTFINSFVGKASTKTGNKPGVTKGKQWIRLSSKIELLDTPGILWPKFEDPAAGMRLAFIGSINDDIIQKTELSLELILFLNITQMQLANAMI